MSSLASSHSPSTLFFFLPTRHPHPRVLSGEKSTCRYVFHPSFPSLLAPPCSLSLSSSSNPCSQYLCLFHAWSLASARPSKSSGPDLRAAARSAELFAPLSSRPRQQDERRKLLYETDEARAPVLQAKRGIDGGSKKERKQKHRKQNRCTASLGNPSSSSSSSSEPLSHRRRCRLRIGPERKLAILRDVPEKKEERRVHEISLREEQPGWRTANRGL